MKLWIQLVSTLALLIGVAVAQHMIPTPATTTQTNNRRWWIAHAAALLSFVLIAALVPFNIATALFTPLTLIVMGTAFPIYESVRAVCTPLEDDDKAWLQYWMVGGVLFMATDWLGRKLDEETAIYWYEFCTLFFVWLYFPLTQGATLLHEHVTEPFLAPRVKPLVGKMDSWIQAAYQMMMNAAHLWVIWLVFIFLPSGLKRTIAVALGTIYPLASSIVAAATEEVSDDTYWLTYWSVYGCLFLIMETLEVWMGWVPGFYSLFILSTVYLMLPMFQGADKMFRKVLVPLAGLQEMIMLRDAIQVKKQMLRDLDPERATAVRQAIAKFYADDNATTVDPAEIPGKMKTEYLRSWRHIKVPQMSNPFGGGSSAGASESTSLV